jgi:ERCC4-type nuclease
MLLQIDNRERSLLELLKDHNSYECARNLELGDIVISHNDEVIAIFERKTWLDLAASIKDGRYHNQKKRLLEKYTPDKIYYILEGTMELNEDDKVLFGSVQKSALLSCFYNTVIRDNINIFRTKNISETADMIKGIYKRMCETPEKYIDGKHIHEEQIIKTSIKTPEEYFLRALCQIPGVSMKTGKAIADRYKTMYKFNSEMAKTQEKLKSLKDITTQDSKGKSRKISDKVAKALLQFIIGEDVVEHAATTSSTSV